MRILSIFASAVAVSICTLPAAHAQSGTRVNRQTAEARSLPQLLAESGFPYSKVNDTTWRIAAKGRVQEVAVFVSESPEAVEFAVKLANRAQLPSDPALINALLA